MFVAATQLVLDFYGNFEVAKKKEELQKLFVELKKVKYNLSIAETDDFHDPEKCSIGLALVASSERAARENIKTILDYIDSHSFARVVMEETHVERY
jgi:uncharacterized protein YlxP (DUF503 family)